MNTRLTAETLTLDLYILLGLKLLAGAGGAKSAAKEHITALYCGMEGRNFLQISSFNTWIRHIVARKKSIYL